MMITKRALSRRTVLRSLGAAVSLPLLDAMVPPLTAMQLTPARPKMRFGAVYVPNGVIPGQWFPSTEGSAFEFSPSLKPLEQFREHILVTSGLDSVPPPPPGERQYNNHADASTRFLTDVTPSRTLRAGISIDQILAKEIGQDTALPSMEMTLEAVDAGSSCDFGRSCIYTGTIAWAGATSPLPMEHDPSAAFVRLFGDGTADAQARQARARRKGSILDSLLDEVSRLQASVSAPDRSRLSSYLESVRDVERRIQKAVAFNRDEPSFDRPAGVPDTFEQHARLMFDLQWLAYQGDVTRVTTFMMGREFSGMTYPFIGVPDAHHPVSHHQQEPEKVAKVAKINHYHVTLFAYLLDKLRSTPDGDGTLLDHSLTVFGSSLSESNLHTHDDLPIVLAGNAGGRIKGNRHVVQPRETPLNNLFLNMFDAAGVPTVAGFGDSTGRLTDL